MSKIAIISQPDQGVLIDVSGCTTLKEALEHLSSTLQVSNNFWQGMHVSINLGALQVDRGELGQVLSMLKAVGITPTGVYSTNDITRDVLKKNNIPIGAGKPMTLPAVSIDPSKVTNTEIEDEGKKASPLASITMRVKDVMTRRGAKEHASEHENELEEMQNDELDQLKHKAGDHESSFPHVAPKKRKVSLDGRKIASEQPAKPVSFEPAVAKVGSEAAAKVSSEPAAKVSSETATVTAGVIEQAEVVDTVVADSEPISREQQSITGPQVEVKVMSIHVSDGMLEAQPASQAIAQGATISGEVVTQVDADCSVDAKVGPTYVDNVDEDVIEDTEDYEIEEEVETETMDMDSASRGGPTTLYLRQNLRSGQTVSHKGHLVIIGDINPGAEVMADGDITVWGCLRGVAHAGIGGNVNAEIRALKLQPIQIRIAHAIARAPDKPRVNYATSNGPETARMVDGKIKVVKSRLD